MPVRMTGFSSCAGISATPRQVHRRAPFRQLLHVSPHFVRSLARDRHGSRCGVVTPFRHLVCCPYEARINPGALFIGYSVSILGFPIQPVTVFQTAAIFPTLNYAFHLLYS